MASRLGRDHPQMRKDEAERAAVILRAILDRIERRELAASARVHAHLEGAVTALEALATRRPK
jgi:hypothetical protein